MILASLMLATVQAPARYAAEWPEVAANCELPGARIERAKRGRRTLVLHIPARVRRTDGRVSCIQLWAEDQGLRLVEPPVDQGVPQALFGCGMPRVLWDLAADRSAIRISFPQRNNMILSARHSGALPCLEDWARDRRLRVEVVRADLIRPR